LVKTKDILKSLGEIKTDSQFLVGFALETENEEENALTKLLSKNADLIVLNKLNDPLAGFGKNTNKVTIFDRARNGYAYEAKSKRLVANDIIDLIIKKLNEKA
jgi:phosphopantothenoylcysteine decarboxylase/phosphopantothenate--cysteine ligase